MRLRRVFTAGAVAAGVIAASTAAAFPSPPVDRSQPLPALTAPALAARYTADSRVIAQSARAGGPVGHPLLRYGLTDPPAGARKRPRPRSTLGA